MIADLMRNDLSRVCRPGSVHAAELFRLESYSSVHHLVSVVEGRLRSDVDQVDLIRAAFPCGSVTGAPKIRAMEVIADLEPVARGPCYGSLGWLGFDGRLDLCVGIRTAVLTPSRTAFHAGGAVVADSTPADEYVRDAGQGPGAGRYACLRDLTVILLIDNYDSFVYNLARYLEELGEDTRVIRNDAISAEAALELGPSHIVLSPGPCTPAEAGICVDLTLRAAGTVPILGVCLGHQCVAAAYGARVVRGTPVHGKISRARHAGRDLFAGLPDPLPVTRYHALVVEPETLPAELVTLAWTRDLTIMALKHRTEPVWGVQFHPEGGPYRFGPRFAGQLSRSRTWSPPLGTTAALPPHEQPPSGVSPPTH